MPDRSRKKPRDLNALAKAIVEESTGQAPKLEPDADADKNPHAVAMGRLGGQKGGPARAAKLSKKKRSEIAKKAAKSRWAAQADKGLVRAAISTITDDQT